MYVHYRSELMLIVKPGVAATCTAYLQILVALQVGIECNYECMNMAPA